MKRLEDMTEPELKDVLKNVCELITKSCHAMEVEKPMFALLMFNDPKVSQYACNCDREDVIKAMRETADRLERREHLERVEFPKMVNGFGATNEFPDGNLHDRDEGGLNYGVGSDRKIGKVIVTFGKPVAWLGFNPVDAEQSAERLNWHAGKARSKMDSSGHWHDVRPDMMEKMKIEDEARTDPQLQGRPRFVISFEIGSTVEIKGEAGAMLCVFEAANKNKVTLIPIEDDTKTRPYFETSKIVELSDGTNPGIKAQIWDNRCGKIVLRTLPVTE